MYVWPAILTDFAVIPDETCLTDTLVAVGEKLASAIVLTRGTQTIVNWEKKQNKTRNQKQTGPRGVFSFYIFALCRIILVTLPRANPQVFRWESMKLRLPIVVECFQVLSIASVNQICQSTLCQAFHKFPDFPRNFIISCDGLYSLAEHSVPTKPVGQVHL